MAAEVTYRQIVREIALDHHGYVTTKEAAKAGVPAVELPKLAARGGLENVAYGLYRVPDMPATANDQFAEALLRVGEGAYLHGETVLALLGFADVNLRQIKLTHVRDEVRTTFYDGLVAQPVADAILECRGRIETDRLLDAAKRARGEGLMTTTEWQRVRKCLRS